MNEKELTDEMIEDACKCDGRMACCNCKNQGKVFSASKCVERFAKALKAEKAKKKDDVWNDAPEAVLASVSFYNSHTRTGLTYMSTIDYTRELPKTKARLIAESIAKNRWMDPNTLCDEIEKAILEAQGDEK